MRAPSAIQRASQPASWTMWTPQPLAVERGAAARAALRASASLATISETTSPAPSRGGKRRNGASVTPDIGARKTRFGSVTGPTASGVREIPRHWRHYGFNAHNLGA